MAQPLHRFDFPPRRLAACNTSPAAGPGIRHYSESVALGDVLPITAARTALRGSPRGRRIVLLPVPSFTPGDETVNWKTSARFVLVDLGGFVITEDNRSSWTLKNGQVIPFTRENLEPICQDIIAQGFLSDPMPATLDGDRPITGPLLNSGCSRPR